MLGVHPKKICGTHPIDYYYGMTLPSEIPSREEYLHDEALPSLFEAMATMDPREVWSGPQDYQSISGRSGWHSIEAGVPTGYVISIDPG